MVGVVLAALGLSVAPLLPARAEIVSPRSTFGAQYATAIPSPARASVEAGLRIWSERVASPLPIEVEVRWAPLPSGVAGAAEPVSYAQVTPDGPLDPVALVNAVTGYDHHPGADIRMTLNSGERWHFGDGTAPAGTTDMQSFVLHEIGHGLGLIGSFARSGEHSLGWGRRDASGVLRPVGMDRLLVDSATGALLTSTATFANPSPELFDAATRRVEWGGSARDSRGRAITLYSPGRYEDHSSLTHLDDDVYPRGDPDSLMTSLIKRGETIRHIGPAALGVLADLGWTVVPEPAAPRPAKAAPQQVAPPPPAATTTTSPPAVIVTVPAPPLAATPKAVPAQAKSVTNASNSSALPQSGLVSTTAIAGLLFGLRFFVRRGNRLRHDHAPRVFE